MDLHPEFPRETVYPEDEELVPYGANKQKIVRLKKTILGLQPVRRAFVLGNMDVILFKPDVAAENVERVLSQLPLGQRFQPRYVDLNGGKCAGKASRSHRRADFTLLAFSRMDVGTSCETR